MTNPFTFVPWDEVETPVIWLEADLDYDLKARRLDINYTFDDKKLSDYVIFDENTEISSCNLNNIYSVVEYKILEANKDNSVKLSGDDVYIESSLKDELIKMVKRILEAHYELKSNNVTLKDVWHNSSCIVVTNKSITVCPAFKLKSFDKKFLSVFEHYPKELGLRGVAISLDDGMIVAYGNESRVYYIRPEDETF